MYRQEARQSISRDDQAAQAEQRGFAAPGHLQAQTHDHRQPWQHQAAFLAQHRHNRRERHEQQVQMRLVSLRQAGEVMQQNQQAQRDKQRRPIRHPGGRRLGIDGTQGRARQQQRERIVRLQSVQQRVKQENDGEMQAEINELIWEGKHAEQAIRDP